jgi:hypothetical protein
MTLAAETDTSMQMIPLGDMLVVGRPPARLLKALAVIADTLHPTFARQEWIKSPDRSKESCVLSSLAVRDFLHSIGIIAEVRPVMLVMLAMKGNETLHSLATGTPEQPDDDHGWAGHLVVTVPGATEYLIDTTLYPTIRPQWRGILSGMMAVPTCRGFKVGDLSRISGFQVSDPADPEFIFEIVWADRPDNTRWKRGGDARQQWRRRAAVAAMRKRFGKWEDR